MKKSFYIPFAAYCLLFIAFLWGCGSGPGSPGSSETEDTGVIIDATVTPLYKAVPTYSVDIFQQICDAGPPPVFEFFADHLSTLTINTRLINPNTVFEPGTLYVEKYTVEFRRATDSITAPPIESDTRFVTIVITPPTGSNVNTLTTNVVLVDLKRKDKYSFDMCASASLNAAVICASDVSSPTLKPVLPENNYTATYTFVGKNQFGTDFSFVAQTNFQIGSFDYCK